MKLILFTCIVSNANCSFVEPIFNASFSIYKPNSEFTKYDIQMDGEYPRIFDQFERFEAN